MSSTMQVKITLSGRAANKLLYVLKIYPANSGAEMLFLLLKALISITAPILTNKTHKLSIKFFNSLLFDYSVSICGRGSSYIFIPFLYTAGKKFDFINFD